MQDPTDLGLLDDLEPEFSQSEPMQRLRQWSTQMGRPLRVLHIGNIANNGYNNAKMLNAAGVESDAIAYDYYHIMGCPEWEDADIIGDIADDMNPDWWAVDLGGFKRPAWFAQGPKTLCTRYLRVRRAGTARELAMASKRLEAARVGQARSKPRGSAQLKLQDLWHKRHRIPNALRWRTQWSAAQGRYWALRLMGIARIKLSVAKWKAHTAWFYTRRAVAGPSAAAVADLPRWAPARIYNALAWRFRTLINENGPATSRESSTSPADDSGSNSAVPSRRRRWSATRQQQDEEVVDPFDVRVQELIELFDELFPDRVDRLVTDDFATYRWSIDDWSETFAHYDLIEAYSTDPILPMLANTRPYIAYEHGTLREIPFEDSSVGRLTALAYRLADGVVITNPDCVDAAKRLGVTNYEFIPHLIDRKYYDEASANERALPPGVVKPYVFCPARQHWDVKGNDIALQAFAAIAAERPDIRLVMSSWGPDIERSRHLLNQLGCGDRVDVIAPLRIRDLISVTRNAEVLIDQFNFAVFGGIGPTALACGTPLVTNLEHELSAWCMEEPPYFQASDLATCTAALREALHVDRDRHRDEQHRWIQSNYWYGDVALRHIEMFLDALQQRQPLRP